MTGVLLNISYLLLLLCCLADVSSIYNVYCTSKLQADIICK
jgi:hypothetical protein